ncbi:hypothetical protein KXD97_00165 [Mycobacterium sp. SMC-8]|uniref:hypothetical protein n=1 Tax=Mycobacterium sp. SMC-8 TaxID=2857060 RepID=UPI0021B27E39|nr:hypothetical protein [Mycobacterium sp. SMC-8]UXA15649.1 hypothetical protein KXD97_00165 [Mycobacterium sp. SMC-8]
MRHDALAVGGHFDPRCGRDILHLRGAFPLERLNPREVQLFLAGQALSRIYTPSNANFREKSGLGVDATAVTGRTALGVRIHSAPACAQGTAWLIPRDRVFVVLRNDPEVVSDPSPFFSSYRTAIRAVLRVGFAFPHEAAVVRVGMDGGS